MYYENQCLKITATTIWSVQTATGLRDTNVPGGIKKTTKKSTNNRIIWQQKIKKKLYIYTHTHRQSYIREITVHEDYVYNNQQQKLQSCENNSNQTSV